MLGLLSANMPPYLYPIANAIITMPMIFVQTNRLVPKYGANKREADISTAMTAMPERNVIRRRKVSVVLTIHIKEVSYLCVFCFSNPITPTHPHCLHWYLIPV